ncbi:BMC domain-containing protein [Clostridium autoethanogenum]|nr:BMC domain-containing protein [Clostridium autoethanogenum]ALU37630.1 Microcompartments protein [Clostridium autoethanogenum DSM 10061]OVY48483.1 Major carboxysome shell protein 1C [Clostridium autoethanogenum]
MQALGLIETIGLIAAIESADAMLKAADVNLLEKTYVGGGLVSIVVTGDVGAVKAAVDAGGAAVRNINDTLLVSQHVIPRPHEELDNIIVSAVPLKDRNIKTVNPEENQSKVVTMVEGNEEESVEVSLKIEELEYDDSKEEDSMIENPTIDDSIVEDPIEEDSKEENSTVENSENEELLPEKITDPLKIDLTKLNRKAVDKMVLDYGLEKAIEILSKFKVIELRNLARKYKNFGIKGRSISKADKMLLLVEFRKYYGHN